MKEKLLGVNVAILATTGFEQVELTSPRTALHEMGAETEFITPDGGEVRAWKSGDWGDTFESDLALADANPDAYDALLLPGGTYNPDKLRVNEDALEFIRHFFQNDKTVAAICHGPWPLINAGVVEGRTMTSYKSVELDLRNAGANWVDQEVAVHGNLITSRNPDDLPAFNEAIVKALEKPELDLPADG